jgi:cobalamin synthase
VTGLGVSLVLNAPVRWMIPLSYFLFGGMWSASCLLKIPLTAHYSMNDYNGEEALRNPLFIQTNRILTCMWGVLYLLIGALCLFSTGFTVVSYVAPAVMGVFTVWFQRWYPAKVAQGK